MLFGSAAAAWPTVARAQQKAMPVIGLLGIATAAAYAPWIAVFRRGLDETGYVEGQNVAIEYRWAEDRVDRLPALAAELVSRKVDVIATTGGTAGVLGGGRTASTTARAACLMSAGRFAESFMAAPSQLQLDRLIAADLPRLTGRSCPAASRIATVPVALT